MSNWERRRIATDDGVGFDRWTLASGASGPRVVILGGVHGDELEGALAAGSLTTRPLALHRGVLEIVPVCHEAAFVCDSRTSPLDGGNLARTFPGAPDGTPTERLASLLTEHVLDGADLLVDLHTSGQSYDMPFVAGFTRDERDPERIGERAATAIGADFLWHHPHRSPGRTLSVVDVGIYVECPGGGPVDTRYVERYVTGVLRVLSELDMVDDSVAPPVERAAIRVAGGGNLDKDMTSVGNTGLFVHAVARGDAVKAGQLLGTVVDVRGSTLEVVRAATDGRVMAVTRRSSVEAGDLVVCLARKT